MKYISCLLSWVIITLFMGCTKRTAHRQDTADVLSQMRADTVFIHELDSMATLALGVEATCIDPVWHLFYCNGRRWFHNPDWGGVLEIPDGFIPQDDYVQAELTFHGTTATRDDQNMTISFHAGFQQETESDYIENVLDSFRDEGLDVIGFDTCDVLFSKEYKTTAYTIRAKGCGGLFFYGRYIPSGPDRVLFYATLMYQNESDEQVSEIKAMIDRYPLSENGSFMKGDAISFIKDDIN